MSAQQPANVMEQYKLAVEMADRVSARRGAANTFFLTVQTALVTVVGSVEPETWVASAAGITLSAVWLLLLRSYRDLNRAKFQVIHALERQLPTQPYIDEWGAIQAHRPESWARYLELGIVERLVPLVFVALYVALLLGA